MYNILQAYLRKYNKYFTFDWKVEKEDPMFFGPLASG
jgi:hypothetical protein